MSTIKIIPLGGVRENGKNMYVAEVGEDIFILDCGLKYPENELLGIDVVIPDFTYLEENIDRVAGVFLTHGHRYQVNFGIQTLKEAALLRGADIAMYGHTHVPIINQGRDVTILNPGSLTLPRQDGFARTYILMEIDREGEAHFTLCKL